MQDESYHSVHFDSDDFSIPRSVRDVSKPLLVRLLIQKGIARDDIQARQILLGVIIIAFLMTALFLFKLGHKEAPVLRDSTTGEEIIEGRIPGQI